MIKLEIINNFTLDEIISIIFKKGETRELLLKRLSNIFIKYRLKDPIDEEYNRKYLPERTKILNEVAMIMEIIANFTLDEIKDIISLKKVPNREELLNKLSNIFIKYKLKHSTDANYNKTKQGDRSNILKEAELIISSIYLTCINDTDLVTMEPISQTVLPRHLIQIPPPPKKGHCFDINDIASHILTGKKNTNPYTNMPLWDNFDDYKKIINHPSINRENIDSLNDLFFPKIDDELTKLVIENHRFITLIGKTGFILANDYTSDFKPSTEALAKLNLELMKVDKRLQTLKTNNIVLNELVEKSSIECIHLIGNNLCQLYIVYWKNILSNIGVPLYYRFQRLPGFSRAFVWLINIKINNYVVVLYITSDIESGLYPNGLIKNKYYFHNYRITEYESDDYIKACTRMGLNPMLENNIIPPELEAEYPLFDIWKIIYLDTLDSINILLTYFLD